MFLKNLRDYANESDVFRTQFYAKFTTARSKFVNRLKNSKPFLLHFSEHKPAKNHFAR